MQYAELTPVIEICASRNIPFGIVAMPGSTDFHFFSSLPDADTGENDISDLSLDKPFMAVSLFDNAETYRIGIRQSLTPSDILRIGASAERFSGPDIRPLSRSTEAIVYDAQVHEIVKKLSGRQKKVVLSRIIAGAGEGVCLAEAADRFFAQFADSYRFMYFTQETGLWIGASPELLMSIDTSTGAFATMALAGTRARGTEGEWDDKNIREQKFVAEYIKATLESLNCADLEITPAQSLPYGSIEHLCTRFGGTIDTSKVFEALSRLSPTPALGGWPKEFALETIYNYEIHQRHCYGGYVAVNLPAQHTLTAFVNLRCAHLYQDTQSNTLAYNVFTGSGLVKGSSPCAEWHETEAKAAALLTALGGTQPSTDGLF